MSASHSVLIVEDEPKIAKLMIDFLNASDIQTFWVTHGDKALACFEKEQPSLVILDVFLPGLDGFSLCEKIRMRSKVPIILVTAKVEENDRLKGFDLGADDYICKPFSPKELVYRVKAVLNRLPATPTSNEHHFGPLTLNPQTLQVTFYDQAIETTPLEFKLLQTLAEQKNRVFSRDELLDHVYQSHRVVNDRTIDSHIKNLRKKLKTVADTEVISSVYGVGYKFSDALTRVKE